MESKSVEQIGVQRSSDRTFGEPGHETARLRLLLEGKESIKVRNGGYWYSTEEATSRTQDYAIQRAYERAVAKLAGIVPVQVSHRDLSEITEKTDETVTQKGSFWTAVVKVGLAKDRISALLGENANAQKPLVELAVGILTDSDFLYVHGSDTSADAQFALDKAKHAARIRLGSYLAGSSRFERQIVGSKTLKQNLARKGRFWVAEVVLKAPVTLNKSGAVARGGGS